jgi:hypothetical protein
MKKIQKKDLGLANIDVLNTKQLQILFRKTPSKYIYQRPAKGGGKWNYVTGNYVRKVLNLMFNFNWDFEVIEHKFDLTLKQVFVLGKLTVRTNNATIVKMQFGSKDIIFRKGTNVPLDLGNDLKAATTSSLKKCASELGIASDVYSPEEFNEVIVQEEVSNDKERILSFIDNIKTKDDIEFIRPMITEETINEFKNKIKDVNKSK